MQTFQIDFYELRTQRLNKNLSNTKKLHIQFEYVSTQESINVYNFISF